MADAKISALTAIVSADVAGTDVLPIVDVSATTTKKITAAELAAYASTGLATTASVDPSGDQYVLSGAVFNS